MALRLGGYGDDTFSAPGRIQQSSKQLKHEQADQYASNLSSQLLKQSQDNKYDHFK
jgi:hypothetical protein